jgi:hypothetical protein
MSLLRIAILVCALVLLVLVLVDVAVSQKVINIVFLVMVTLLCFSGTRADITTKVV